MKRVLFLSAAVAVLLAAPAAAHAGSFTVQKVRGDLEATDSGSKAKGKFLLLAATSGTRKAGKLYVVARRLAKDATFDVVLEDADGDRTTFGEMKIRGRGIGLYRFSSKRDDLPDSVDGLADFSGGKVLLVSDDETVLSGDIPDFVEPGTDDEAGGGSFAFGYGSAKLSPPEGDDSDALARLYAVAVNTPRGARETISLFAVGLDEDETYGVYVGDDRIGSLRPRGRFGVAWLLLDTGRGHDLPHHLSKLAGKTVEIRSAAGDVVLTGEFPALK